MSGKQPGGDRLEGFHELLELGGIEALIGLRREVIRDRLDPLSDGTARLGQPTVIADKVATAHPVDHRGELRRRKVLDAPERLRRYAQVEREQDMSFQATDALDHQRRDVPVATVLAQQGGSVKETG